MARNKYFTERERYQLEVLLKEKYKVKDIAIIMDKCQKTIYNEINRGTVKLLDTNLNYKIVYLADTSQNKYENNRKQKGRTLKIGNDYEFVKFCEQWIKKGYSPYSVLQKIKNENLKFNTDICITTLYNYIESGIFLNVTNKNLPVKRNKRKNKYNKIRSVCLHNLKGPSIEQRSKEILNRNDFGHWEMDTVVSGMKKGKSCLLVFTERKTRIELIYKLPARKLECVASALDHVEKKLGTKQFRNTFKTITCDNGVEFLDYQRLQNSSINKKMKRTNIYFCHPYCSSERGSNENANRLIRRHIPKGANIDNYSDEDILYIQEWINNYPRRLFGGLSSNDMVRNVI